MEGELIGLGALSLAPRPTEAIRPEGTLRDRNSLPRCYWEAKDTQDDLDTEIKKKIGRGPPLVVSPQALYAPI